MNLFVVGALLCALAADPTHDQSSTKNNAANRGITGEKNDRHEQKRARRNSQARGRNPKGSLSRPAESPAQLNRNPKPMGSGAPMTPVSQEPQPEGRNYDAGPQPGAAGGVASDTGPTSPGAAATTGTAGKATEPKQDEKK